MLVAVSTAFSEYKEGFDHLRRQMEENLLLVSVGLLEPKVRLVLKSTALEVFIRYPVNSKNAAAIDGSVNRELLRAIELEPKLKVLGADAPTAPLRPGGPSAGAPGG